VKREIERERERREERGPKRTLGRPTIDELVRIDTHLDYTVLFFLVAVRNSLDGNFLASARFFSGLETSAPAALVPAFLALTIYAISVFIF
jgi:hypothetical protein